MSNLKKLPAGVVVLAMSLFFSCATGVQRDFTPARSLLDEQISPNERATLVDGLEEDSPYLKAHMLNGEVYVLSDQNIDTDGRTIRGSGLQLGVNRDTLNQGYFTISLDSVAIFETNSRIMSAPVAAMAVVTGASLALTAYCIINPKACFGSCPTFYVSDGQSLTLQAEGFSSSIAPSLEARDIDALFLAQPEGSIVDVEMRNEALETHVVRYVNLLLAPKLEHGRVMVDTDDAFWHVPTLHEPRACLAGDEDCLSAVRALDGLERFTAADSTDLATREYIDLEFAVPSEGHLGLVIGARQTLLTTYLLYQTLAYMGRDVGEWFALLERHDQSLLGTGLGDILGNIEVLVQDGDGAWRVVGEVGEHGPLATDVHLVHLPALPSEAVRVRLRLTRGNWRLDYVALAEVGDPVDPVRLRPSVVLQDGVVSDRALMLLEDDTEVLITFPGDLYTLRYELPSDAHEYELFLESRGYYLEWIRADWLKEENPQRLAQIMFNTDSALRDLAPEFKSVEAQMEDIFWRSRYANQ